MTPDQERILRAVENYRLAEARAGLMNGRGEKGIAAANNAARRFNELMAVIMPDSFPFISADADSRAD